MLFIVCDNEMLCSIRHSLSSGVHACRYLPFVSHAPQTGFSVAPERKHNRWCFLKRLGTNVKPNSALPRLCLRSWSLLPAAARPPSQPAPSLACCGWRSPGGGLPSRTGSRECPRCRRPSSSSLSPILLKLRGA